MVHKQNSLLSQAMLLGAVLMGTLVGPAHAGPAGFSFTPSQFVDGADELLSETDPGGVGLTLDECADLCRACASCVSFEFRASDGTCQLSCSACDDATAALVAGPFDFYLRTDIGDPCNPPRCLCGNGLRDACPGLPAGPASRGDLDSWSAANNLPGRLDEVGPRPMPTCVLVST